MPIMHGPARARCGRIGRAAGRSCFDGDVTTTAADDQLTILDRCDACGAQAYVRVVLPYGELLFCGHHANAHLEKLAAAAICVHDERSRIASDGQAQGAGEA